MITQKTTKLQDLEELIKLNNIKYTLNLNWEDNTTLTFINPNIHKTSKCLRITTPKDKRFSLKEQDLKHLKNITLLININEENHT